MAENYEDPQDASRRNDNLRDYNKLMGDFLRDLEDRMSLEEKQARQLKNTQDRFKDLDTALKNGSRRSIDLTKDFRSLQAAINQLEDGVEKERLQKDLDVKASKARTAVMAKAAIDATAAVGTALVRGGVDTAKAVAQSYMSGASAFTTAGAVINAGLDASANAVGGATAAIATAAIGIGALGGLPGVIGGAIVAGMATLFGSIYKGSVELAKQATSLAVAEMENTIKAYTTASKAGALFADGLTGLRTAAKKAGLDQTQYANVLAQTTPMLAQFGGSVSQGVQRFTNISGIMNKQFAPGLIKLGYSLEEVAAGTADYLGTLGRYGLDRGKTDAQLAVESDKYLTNLKAISAYTGENAAAAKSRVQGELDQVAIQSKLNDIAKGSGQTVEQVMLKYDTLLRVLGPGSEKIAGQMLTLGTTTGNLAVVTGQVPASLELMKKAQELLGDKTLDNVTIQERLVKLENDYTGVIKEQILATGKGIGIANQANGTYSAETKILAEMLVHQNKLGKVQGTQVKDAEKTKTTQDKLTENYVDATVAFQKMRIQIQDKLTPALGIFADVTKQVIEELDKILAQLPGMAPTPPVNSTTPPVAGADVKKDWDAGKGAPKGYKNWSEDEKQQSAEAEAGRRTQQKAQEEREKRRKAVGEANVAKRDAVDGWVTKIPGVNYSGNMGKGIQTSLYDLLLTPQLFGKTITSLYRDEAGSAHSTGKAADVSIAGMSTKQIADLTAQIQSTGMLKKGAVFGAEGKEGNADDEQWVEEVKRAGGYGFLTPKNRGRHIHLESRRYGGGVDGTTLVGENGPELLDSGSRGMVTSTSSTNSIFSELNQNIKDLLSVTKDHARTSEKIYNATA